MQTIEFKAPTKLANDSHVRDAKLWAWVEAQDVCTIDDVSCRLGIVTVIPMLDLTAEQTAYLCLSFRDFCKTL